MSFGEVCSQSVHCICSPDPPPHPLADTLEPICTISLSLAVVGRTMPLLSLTPRSLPCCVCRFLGDPLSDSSLPSDSGLPDECTSEQSVCDADTACSAILQAATGDSGPEPDVCNANQACAVLMACMNGSGDGPPSGSGDGDGSSDGPGDGMYTPRHARPSYSAPTYTVYSVQCTVYSVHATT